MTSLFNPKSKEPCLHAKGLVTVLIPLGQVNNLLDVTFGLLCGFQGKSANHFSDVAIFTATGPIFMEPRRLH